MTLPKALIAASVLVSMPTASAFAQLGDVGVPSSRSLVVKPLVEKKVTKLPAAPLFWRIESFPSLAAAQADAGPTSLAAKAGGKAWLFTLGPAGGSSSAATKLAEIGPVPSLTAPAYLLRVNEASGPPGSVSPIHSPSRLRGRVRARRRGELPDAHGIERVGAGKSNVGASPDTPMEASSSGTTNLHAFIMFVVDASQPFSRPARFP
jgi:hypothetical protein